MGDRCGKAVHEKTIRSRLGHGERLYAAVTDQLLAVRGRPRRLGLDGGAVSATASGTDVVSADPPRVRPRPNSSANVDRRSE
jgi:hypothetical protein